MCRSVDRHAAHGLCSERRGAQCAPGDCCRSYSIEQGTGCRVGAPQARVDWERSSSIGLFSTPTRRLYRTTTPRHTTPHLIKPRHVTPRVTTPHHITPHHTTPYHPFLLCSKSDLLSHHQCVMQVVEETTAAGIDALIYCHPIGDHMHGAGATIGLSDMDNQPVPVKGDVRVLADSWCDPHKFTICGFFCLFHQFSLY